MLRAHRKALERLRLEEQPSDIAAGQVEFCCSRTGFDEATARHIVTELFDQAPIRFLSECRQPGLEEFLVEARKAGVCLGIVSDYPASTKLRALNLEGFFDVVVDASSPSVGRLKPHPLALSFCLEQLCVHPAGAIYIGDRSDVDVPCALRAGVHPVVIGSKRRSNLYSSAFDYTELGGLCRPVWSRPEVSFA